MDAGQGRKESLSTDIASMMESRGACSGALLKREKQLGTWRRRIFALANMELRYFAREDDTEPVGHVRVVGVSSVLSFISSSRLMPCFSAIDARDSPTPTTYMPSGSR